MDSVYLVSTCPLSGLVNAHVIDFVASDGGAVVLDMSTTTVPLGKVEICHRKVSSVLICPRMVSVPVVS